MNNLIIKYNANAKTLAGFRSVVITATTTRLSDKRVVVKEVLAIDDEQPHRNMSRTGAKRQTFDGLYLAKLEVGKTKNLSTCDILN